MTYAEGIALAAELYGDARDRSGGLALLHPIAVAECLSPHDESGRIAALFHDAMEDGFVGDLEDIPRVSSLVLRAVGLLTRQSGETYSDYIDRIAAADGEAGDLARRVKVADLIVNFGRCLELEDGESLRLRYAAALRKLLP